MDIIKSFRSFVFITSKGEEKIRHVYVAVNFLFQLIFGFPLFLNSLAYTTILRNNGKIKIN